MSPAGWTTPVDICVACFPCFACRLKNAPLHGFGCLRFCTQLLWHTNDGIKANPRARAYRQRYYRN